MKKKYLTRFFAKLHWLYWFIIQGKTSVKETFEDMYRNDFGETFRAIYRTHFGDEYAEEINPCGFSTRSDIENIKQSLNLESGGRVLDLACGEGGNGLTIARDLKAELDGMDLSETAIEKAKQRMAEFDMTGHARFVVGDARSLPFDDHVFDASMCVDSLYMIPDKQTVLGEVKRVMQPERPFVILTWEVHRPFAVSDYRPLLDQCGFRVTEYREVPGWFERQRATYQGMLDNKDALIREMGAATASVWINAAKTELPKLDKMRRVFIVAETKQ